MGKQLRPEEFRDYTANKGKTQDLNTVHLIPGLRTVSLHSDGGEGPEEVRGGAWV